MSSVELGFNSEARKALASFVEAKALADKAEAMKAEAEAKLRELLGQSNEATFGGVVAFKLVSRTNTYVDSKKLANDFPEAYEATRYARDYDFVKVAR